MRVLIAATICASCLFAASGGPSLGKWAFSGKDNSGIVWTGTLTIERLDANRFDAARYHSLCSLEVQSPDPSKGTRGVEAPCKYDASTRGISFSTGVSTEHTYTAVVSADGKSMARGKWTETKGGTAVRTGEWPARLRQ